MTSNMVHSYDKNTKVAMVACTPQPVRSRGSSLVNQTVFRERACASEKGEGKEKYGLAKLARFSRLRQDLVVTNQIADPA